GSPPPPLKNSSGFAGAGPAPRSYRPPCADRDRPAGGACRAARRRRYRPCPAAPRPQILRRSLTLTPRADRANVTFNKEHPMSRSALWMVSFASLCAAWPALADERSGAPAGNQQTTVIHGAQVVGRPMPPVSLDVDLRELPAPPEWQPGDPIREIPRRGHRPAIQPPPVPE